MKRLLLFILASAIVLTAPAGIAKNRKAPAVIRDTEIEAIFQEWMEPLLEAADLPKKSVNLILVQSNQINAFVAGGANIFIYTGLIERTENPNEMIGVLAHELGHVAGGHLIGMRAALERASYESILGMVLGVGAAIATGNGGAAQAIISGTGTVAQRKFLAHSRVNESSADQAALTFLEKADINPSGLESFLKKLESEELMPSNQQSEYVRTHPLTHNRIEALQTRLKTSSHQDAPLPDRRIEQHARMKAKLISYIDPGRVPWVYDDSDKSVPARYARAIAAYRQKRTQDALKEINGLIGLESNNPYSQELKGQMLMSFGRITEALPYYKRAVTLLPEAGLIRIDFARALLETGSDSKNMDEAIDNLKRALHSEPRASRAYRLLATAYGRERVNTCARPVQSPARPSPRHRPFFVPTRLGRRFRTARQCRPYLLALSNQCRKFDSLEWARSKEILVAMPLNWNRRP